MSLISCCKPAVQIPSITASLGHTLMTVGWASAALRHFGSRVQVRWMSPLSRAASMSVPIAPHSSASDRIAEAASLSSQ